MHSHSSFLLEKRNAFPFPFSKKRNGNGNGNGNGIPILYPCLPKSRIQKKIGKWIYVWNIFLILRNSAFDNSSNPRPNWTIPRRKMVDTIPSSFSVKIWGWGVLCTLLSQAKQRSSRSKKELHLGLSRPLYTMMKTNRSLLLQSNALRERASIFKLLQFALKL